jgi:hypothetical protein
MRELQLAINYKRSQLSRVITHHCEEISRPAGCPRFVDADDLAALAFRLTVTSICNITTKYIALQTI